jgi:TRAP-type C4-dicarboxylate transport system permease small subunit
MNDSVKPTTSADGDSPEVVGVGNASTTRPGEAWFERACRHLCRWALLLMVLIVAIDIFTRSVLNFSFEIADELGGYFLAAISFLALSVTRAHDGFHRVEFVYDQLGPRNRAIASLVFDLVAMTLATILLIYLVRYVHATWESGSVAPTRLMTPLWLAQMPLVVGLVAYCLSLLRGIIGKWLTIRQDSKSPALQDR